MAAINLKMALIDNSKAACFSVNQKNNLTSSFVRPLLPNGFKPRACVSTVKKSVALKVLSAAGIEAEVPLETTPESLLREAEKGWDNPATASMRARFERMILDAQNSICAAVEEVDGKKFRQDSWAR